jgi:hypothetical protein
MSSRLSPALAEFAEGRWLGERAMDLRQPHRREPDLGELEPMHPHSMEPPLHPSEIDRFEREPRSISRWILVGFFRFAIFFFIGVVATLAWQSYGYAARRLVAHLAPGLGWLAPPVAPPAPGSSAAGPTAVAPPDQLAAVSRSLTAVRQSVDKLAADVSKLQAAKPDPAVRTGPPASLPPASAQGRKPATQAASSR